MADLASYVMTSPQTTGGNILVLPLQVNDQPPHPTSTLTHHPSQLDALALNASDESLADLQPEPEEEGGRRGGWEGMDQEQRKMEYMASLGLVSPAVLEEIHRRQQLCKAEYGNWWDRLHSTDFCLVPKSESALHSLHNLATCEKEGSEEGMGECDGVSVGEVTQVASGPDAGALVEQITYLTSWPQTTPPETASSVEVVTQPTAVSNIHVPAAAHSGGGDLMSQTLREHYSGLLAPRDQISEEQFQAALQLFR